MSVNPNQAQTKPVKITYQTLNSWGKGVYTRLDRDRIPQDGLASAENSILSQNGTVGPRPGTRLYGTYQPVGTVQGQVYEFVKPNTSVTPNRAETWLIWQENRSGVGTILVNRDGGTPTVVSGKTYAVTNVSPHFEQIAGKVLITNGVDALSYMDITTLTITSFASVITPTAVSATATTGIAGSTYTLRYRVAATSTVGETAASNAVTVQLKTLREAWVPTTDNVTFVWNRITSGNIPVRWNIYVGDQAGNEYFIDSVVDAGTGTTQTYVDNGSIAQNALRVAPAGDSTSGPKTLRSTNIKGQVYMVGDSDHQDRVWFGGAGDSALDFSSYNGGGWVSPNKGGKDYPVKVVPFRDGKGTPMAACLSKGTNGAGKRYLLQPATTTLGTTVISYMSVTEDNGQDGTDSPDGVVLLNDAIWYPSRSGFKTSSTKANIPNLISTTGITDNISVNVNNLSAINMISCVSVAYDQRIMWSLPYSNTTNNQIWVLDLRQQGAWVRPWNISADWLWLYADNTDGNTKILGLVANQFVQFDDTVTTNDNGVPFQTSISSGSIKFGPNEEWASVIDVTFWFLEPQGNINLSVSATTEDGIIPFSDTMRNTSNQVASSWGRAGWSRRGWASTNQSLIPITSAKPRQKWTIEIGELCQELSFSITTTEPGVNYELSEIIIRSVPVGYLDQDNGS